MKYIEAIRKVFGATETTEPNATTVPSGGA